MGISADVQGLLEEIAALRNSIADLSAYLQTAVGPLEPITEGEELPLGPAVNAIVEGAGMAGGGIAKGTVFPLEPANDDIFYRTDQDIMYYWTGQNWLSVHEYVADLQADSQLPVSDNARIAVAPMPSDQGVVITRTYWIVQVLQAQDSSNYHVLQLRNQLGNQLPNSSINTDVMGATLLQRFERQVNQFLPASNLYIQLSRRQQIGAPGAVYAWVTVYYRLLGA